MFFFNGVNLTQHMGLFISPDPDQGGLVLGFDTKLNEFGVALDYHVYITAIALVMLVTVVGIMILYFMGAYDD